MFIFSTHTLHTFFENETWLAKFLCADEDLKGKKLRGERVASVQNEGVSWAVHTQQKEKNYV